MRVPDNIINLVKTDKVIFSFKAELALANGRYDYYDFLNSILKGTIKKKEKDEQKQSRYKYTIIGPALDGSMLYSCGKIVQDEEKIYFVITFHGAD